LETLFVERIDQNQDIFVRFMNDAAFQKVVTEWMASEAYRRLRATSGGPSAGVAPPVGEEPIPSFLHIVRPSPEDRYVTCVPLVPLKAAAGAFSDPQHIEDDNWDWVEIQTKRRLRRGMFVAQVVGQSMEPLIHDGSYCLFSAPVTGSRQGKIVLVQYRGPGDPETGGSFTIKRYRSTKTGDQGEKWKHTQITLEALSPNCEAIVLSPESEGDVEVIAEYILTLGNG
jgi:hypothetical protein